MSTQNERSIKAQVIWNSTNSNSVTPTMVGSLFYDINVEKLERDNSNAVYQTYDASYTKVAAINPTTKKMTLIDIPSGSGDLSNYYTKTEVDTALALKQKKVTVITITGNTTLSETHNGAVLNVTNTCTITIPTGLDANFQCVIFAKGSVIVTFVNGGVTVYAPSGLLLKTDKMASLISTSANNFNLTGELATT